MLRISVAGNRDRTVLIIEGHADFGPRGIDIVCAAASGIVESALLGLKRLSHAYPENASFEDLRESDTSGQSLF